MTKKTKTKAQKKAEEDANLDEALAETFPGRPALDDPAPDRGGRAAEKTEETSEGRSAAPEDHKSSVTRLEVVPEFRTSG